MNWQEERYVRVYTRDTPDWVALDWQARAVFVEILRKSDRRGTVELGRSGASGLAQLVRIPLDVVERALAQLLEDGCVHVSGTTLQVPNFVAAQEACATEARRAREYRERLRERGDQLPLPIDSLPPSDAASEPDLHHDSSRAPDARDAASRTVTPSHAVPSRAEPIGDPPVSPPRGQRSRATRLSLQWHPSEATLARFRDEPVDLTRSLERFREYFAHVSVRRVDWNKRFQSWVLQDIEDGRHKPPPAPEASRSTPPPTPAPDALSPDEARQHFERLEQELRGAGAIPWAGAA